MPEYNQDPAAAMPPGQFRMILRYKQQATSFKQQIRMILINKKKKEKLQASSLTTAVGFDRTDLERNNYE